MRGERSVPDVRLREILNECKRRWPGARVKHWMKGNWIKMYDKHGCVLRVETVIMRQRRSAREGAKDVAEPASTYARRR